MNKKHFIILGVIIMVVGGGAFYGGMKYGQSTRQNFVGKNLGGQEFGMGSGVRIRQGIGGQGQGFVSGEIIANDGKSITVKLPNGGSKIIFYSDTTEVGKFVNGATADLKIGETISVTGKANQDGSISAQTIQLR